jgi:pSer/pThr/pTyr-binding forkhead associated (FHA) protein
VKAKLFCKTGSLAGAAFDIREEATIGKDPGNTIQLTPPVISGTHARIFFDRARQSFFIEDLKSRNGTWVDGVRVHHRERLEKLSVITFAGSFDFIFRVLTSETEAGKMDELKRPSDRQQSVVQKTIVDDGSDTGPDIPSESREVRNPAGGKEKPPVPPVIPAQKGATRFDDEFIVPPVIAERKENARKESGPGKVYCLKVEVSGSAPVTMELREGENTVGRESSCDVVVNDPSVSRRHAIITVGPGGVTVKDLGSKNRTLVNNTRIEGEVRVGPETEVFFGVVKSILVEKQ